MKIAKAFWCRLLQPSVSWIYLELPVSYCLKHCQRSREVMVKKKNKCNFHPRWFFLVPTVAYILSKGRGTLWLQVGSFPLRTVGSFHTVCLLLCFLKIRKCSKSKVWVLKINCIKIKSPCLFLPWHWPCHLAWCAAEETILTVHFSVILRAESKAWCCLRPSTFLNSITHQTFLYPAKHQWQMSCFSTRL